MKPRKTAVSGDRVFVPEGISAREFDGEWVVLDLLGGNYFGLDEMGGLIWQQLRAGKSVKEISDLLAENYDAPEATILEDVLRLVNELLERGLVQIRE